MFWNKLKNLFMLTALLTNKSMCYRKNANVCRFNMIKLALKLEIGFVRRNTPKQIVCY